MGSQTRNSADVLLVRRECVGVKPEPGDGDGNCLGGLTFYCHLLLLPLLVLQLLVTGAASAPLRPPAPVIGIRSGTGAGVVTFLPSTHVSLPGRQPCIIEDEDEEDEEEENRMNTCCVSPLEFANRFCTSVTTSVWRGGGASRRVDGSAKLRCRFIQGSEVERRGVDVRAVTVI